MPQVQITGYYRGLNTIQVIKAIQRFGGMGLADAKKYGDSFIAGETVIVPLATLDKANDLASELVSLGAIATVIESTGEVATSNDVAI